MSEDAYQAFKDMSMTDKMYVLEKFRMYQMNRELERYLEPMPEWDDEQILMYQYQSRRQVPLDARFMDDTIHDDLLMPCSE